VTKLILTKEMGHIIKLLLEPYGVLSGYSNLILLTDETVNLNCKLLLLHFNFA